MSLYHYRPQRSCGQGYVFTRVCHSVNMGGGLPQCMLGYHPPGSRPPPKEAPPGSRYPPPRHTVNERPVRILLECILVLNANTIYHLRLLDVETLLFAGYFTYTVNIPTSRKVHIINKYLHILFDYCRWSLRDRRIDLKMIMVY